MTFETLFEKVKSDLAEDKDIKIKAADIEYFTQEQISALQAAIDSYNSDYIDNALRHRVINREMAEYLHGIYDNSMKTYKMLYSSITNTILEKYGNKKDQENRKVRGGTLSELLGRKFQDEEIGPQAINYIDLETGQVELNPAYPGSDKKYKEYHPRHVTPFTSMRLVFNDYRGNPLYVIMPGLKNVRRAIDKIRLPEQDRDGHQIEGSQGGKYFEAYAREANTVYGQCLRKGMEEHEIMERMRKVEKPHERLKDVLRLTILRKYLSDTRETEEILMANEDLHINPAESKDGYRQENINEKNYRDSKVYPHLDMDGQKAAAEIQIKIIKFYEGDIQTHNIYAGKGVYEPESAIEITSANTADKGLRYWQENLQKFLCEGQRRIANYNIFKMKQQIQKCNKDVIRDYNLIVIDKAFRIETAQLAAGETYDAECLNAMTGKHEKICLTSADFLMENFAYRAFKSFDLQDAFDVSDEKLRGLGLLITSEQLGEFTKRYSRFIIPHYNGIFNGDKAKGVSFDLKKSSSRQFLTHGYLDYSVPYHYEVEPSAEEQEVLSAMDKSHYDFGGKVPEPVVAEDKTVAKIKINKHNMKRILPQTIKYQKEAAYR